MDTTLTHEATARFEALEARIAVLEEAAGIEPETGDEEEVDLGETEE